MHFQDTLQAKSRLNRPYKLSALAFLLPYFAAVITIRDTETVLPTRFVEWALIALVSVVFLLSGVRAVELERVVGGLFVLLLLAAVYLVSSEPSWVERLVPYIGIYAALYGATVLFAALLFSATDFVMVFYRLSIASAIIAVLSWLASIALSMPVLTNARGGSGVASFRLQGLLAEPSNWAPIVIAMIILAWMRRNWWVILLAIVVAVLSQSPTVFLVGVLSLVLYLLLATPWRASKVPITIASLILFSAAGSYALSADGQQLSQSSNFFINVLGRLVIGVQGAINGDATAEARLRSTDIVIQAAMASGRFEWGNGLNSASLYFEEIYGAANIRANALWVRAIYEVGLFGCIIILVLIVISLIRLAKFPILAAVFIPIFVTSMVNSAHQLNKLAILGILLFAFRWGGDADANEFRTLRRRE